jgi:hypothetical protein
LLIFEDKRQTLMLQSQYFIPRVTGETNLGWVVPVPGVPDIETIPADTASQFPSPDGPAMAIRSVMLSRRLRTPVFTI